MRAYRLPVIALCLCLSLLFPCFLPTSLAADTPTSIVDATITATYLSGTTLRVSSQMLVHRIDNIFGVTYDQDGIEHLASTDDMGAIKLRLRDSLDTQLRSSFPNAQITPLGRPVYAQPYFTDDYSVNLTSAFFAAPASVNITPFIAGMLDLGADVTYHFSLASENGWNSTYLFTVPSTMQIASATSDQVSPDNQQVTWVLTNYQGAIPQNTTQLSIRARNPTGDPNAPENISIGFDLDAHTPTTVALVTHLLIHTLDISAYNILPSYISHVTTLPADGLRLLAANDLFSWDAVRNRTIQPLIDRLQPLLEASRFNQTLAFSFSWDTETTTACAPPYNVSHMDETPAVSAQYLDSDVRLTIGNISARAFFGLVNAGANASITPNDLNFGSGLTGLGHPYTITLQLPQNITLDHQNPYDWSQTTGPSGQFYSDLQPTPPYTSEKRATLVQIDVAKMDLNLPTLFTGKTELVASTTLTQDESLYVLQTPDAIHFPSCLTLRFLNADAFRLCTEEGLLSSEAQTALLASNRALFESRVSTLLSGRSVKVLSNTKTYYGSLQWNDDIAAMDNHSPIILSTYADDAYSVGANFSLAPASFTISPLQFSLPHLANASATYRIILPAGLTLMAVNAFGQSYSKGNTSDDRQYLEFVFNESNQTIITPVTCYLSCSSLYVLSLFLPLILVIVLLVILVVIILLIRKRRKRLPHTPRKKPSKRKKDEEAESSGDEDVEDFYVPPPPPSSRKR